MNVKKIKKELVYKKGLAVHIIVIEEMASEYSSETRYVCKLYFKSKNAISRAGKILGYKLNKKDVLKAFSYGVNGFKVGLDEGSYHALQSEFEFIPHIGARGFNYLYENTYTSHRMLALVSPIDMLSDMTDRQLDTQLGSCADSEGTFKEYLRSIERRIENGSLYYCTGISY